MEDAFKLGTDNLLFYVAGSGFFLWVCVSVQVWFNEICSF